MRAFTGAMDLPSPVISVVMPCVIFDAARPSTSTKSSDWPSMSMKPGATTRPVTSTRVRRRRTAEVADGGDAVAGDGQVGPHPRRAGAVDKAAAGQNDVIGRRLARRDSGAERKQENHEGHAHGAAW